MRGEVGFSYDPITEDELTSENLAPAWLVENYLYRDLAVLSGPGGTSKTTLCLWEAAHIALGRQVYGLTTRASSTLYVTGEDSRGRLVARLREVMRAMELTKGDRETVLERARVIDLTGRPFRLCELDRNGNSQTSDYVPRLCDAIRPFEPGMVIFDPLASFGAPEQSVNDAAQGAVNAARRIIRDIGCCVRIVSHTGQAVARENIRDQYSSRGGTALPDGARMVAVISRPNDSEHSPFPVGKDDHVMVLSRPKGSFCRPQPNIFIKRSGFHFEHYTEIKRTAAETRSEHADQIETFLVHQLKLERYHSKNTLEPLAKELQLSRNELRMALHELVVTGRLTEQELPDDRKHGGRKTYLCPYLAGFEKDSGEVGPEKMANAVPTSPASTTSPPLRKKIGGEVEAADSFSPFPPPRGEVSARYGEVGEVAEGSL